MIYIFGQKGCTKCLITEGILMGKNIDFEYYDIGEVYEDKELMKLRNKVKKQATKTLGADYPLPLLSKDETLTELDELITNA